MENKKVKVAITYDATKVSGEHREIVKGKVEKKEKVAAKATLSEQEMFEEQEPQSEGKSSSGQEMISQISG